MAIFNKVQETPQNSSYVTPKNYPNRSDSIIRPSVICEGAQADGKFEFSGHLQLDGRFKGELNIGHLTISRTGVCEGVITCQTLTIKGKFSGQARCIELDLAAGADVAADIDYQYIRIATHAKLSGILTKFSE